MAAVTPRKEHDPHWPFPQYDEQGRQLLPPPAPRQPKHEVDWNDFEEALM